MLAAFSIHINHHFLFLKNKKLLIAISGGIDSVVLTHLLHQLKINISLAHCNFNLRGKASDQDEKFVKQLAAELQIPIFIKKFDTNLIAKQEKLSTQLAARNLRYHWFNELIEKENLDYIVTAHHADDSLETFLINTIRGTGLNGLTGIPEQNKNIVRPLLPFTRKQIEEYAKAHALLWREDSTNAETHYLRNKIRHTVIPTLKELNPSLLTSFSQTIDNLKMSRQIIDDTIAKIKKTVIHSDKTAIGNTETGIEKIDISKLKQYKNPKAYLYELLKTYNFTEWNDVANLLEAQTGKQLFSATHRLVKDRAFLLISRITQVKLEQKLLLIDEGDSFFENNNLKLKITTKKQKAKSNKQQIAEIDKDLLKFPLTVRKWQNSDYFYPFGMQGKKKVSKFFKDEKMSILDKENTWLLCSNKEIIWIIGKRLDNRYKITKNTKNILKIEKL